MKHHLTKKSATFALATAVASGAMLPAEAAQIQLNGQPLNTSVSPVTTRGRILVPMRDIFEALGATVNWNALTQGITARRGATQVEMQMGRTRAVVNGQNVRLDQAPMTVRGRTLVPLRFVSEALGANVNWNKGLQLVSIESNSITGGRQVAGVRDIRIPSGVVIPVTLDEALSSSSARVGDRFTTTVRSERLGDSEFPAGSKIEGIITEAKPKRGDEPGVLDVDFDAVVLPDGSRYAIRGDLASLENDAVTTNANGRLVSRNTGKSGSDRLKVIGIGAGVGYVIGKVLLKKNGALSAVLGGVGGYLYEAQRNKNKSAEAVVPRGTAIGVRLNSAVAYRDTTNYAPARSETLRLQMQ